VHKLAASVSVLALAALSLVGCAAAGSSNCTPVSPADAATQKLVTTSGELGAVPDTEVFKPLHVDEGVSWQEIEGDGAVVSETSQLFGAEIELINGTSGETIYQSTFGETASQIISGDLLDGLLPGAGELLQCAHAESRTVFALPASGLAEDALSQFQLDADDTIVGVVDVRDVYLSRANGADQFHTGTGLPSVVRATDGQTGVVIPDLDPPTSTVVQVVKKGDGAEVAADSVVLVQYTAVSWNDRELIKSTWDENPAAITPTDETQPFGPSLEGQTVGSQVMVVVPVPADQGGQTAADANVYVVDILGIAPASASQ
jgi:hypothetical protein